MNGHEATTGVDLQLVAPNTGRGFPRFESGALAGLKVDPGSRIGSFDCTSSFADGSECRLLVWGVDTAHDLHV